MAEWAEDSGNMYLLRTRIEITDEAACETKEHYKTVEVTPEEVERMGVLEPWRAFEKARPDEWRTHNRQAHDNWKKEKDWNRKVEKSRGQGRSGSCFPRFWCFFDICK